MTAAPAISLRKVSMKFIGHDGSDVYALKDVSLDIAPNEFVAVVGPSGCGKSTILNLVAGLLRPAEGQVAVDGSPVSGLKRSVGYVSQADNLFPWRTLEENVELGLEVRGLARVERRRRTHEQLAKMGLSGFERAYPYQLSGGMRQRGNIARTLVCDPEIMLMDEPFGPLDALTRNILQNQLLEIWQQSRKTVIFVTHDLTEAVALADRVVVMSSRPGTVKLVQRVPIPRPRNVFSIQSHPEFPAIHDALLQAVLAEVPELAASWQGAQREAIGGRRA